MIDYINLEIITGKIEYPTHCRGLNDSPPLLSGTNYGKCNAENGCKNTASYSDTHHKCGPPTILYCECPRNRDYVGGVGGGNRIKHYFLPEDLASDSDGVRCAYCREHCT